MKTLKQKGISALEVMVVVAILGMLALVVLPQFSKMRDNQVTKTAVGYVLSSLDKARSQAISSLDSSPYGVRFESSQVIIFKGTSYVSGSSDNEILPITYPASISNVTLSGISGSSGELYFNKLTGSPSKTGTIVVSGTATTKTITLSATGVASSN